MLSHHQCCGRGHSRRGSRATTKSVKQLPSSIQHGSYPCLHHERSRQEHSRSSGLGLKCHSWTTDSKTAHNDWHQVPKFGQSKCYRHTQCGTSVYRSKQVPERMHKVTCQAQTAAAEGVSNTEVTSVARKPTLVSIRNLSFEPPGVPAPLLNNINMEVPANSLGLIIGRSGSGKTTLLQVLAGLCEQTSGTVHINRQLAQATQLSSSLTATNNNSNSNGNKPDTGPKKGAKFAARMASENRPVKPAVPQPTNSNANGDGVPRDVSGPLSGPVDMAERMAKVGLVFQFPERHFLGTDVFSELTFSWPRTPTFFLEQAAMQARVMKVLQAVGLAGIDMRLPPRALSGGQQRRLALAIQLIRQPALLLLDEPLAGLDWQARQEVVELLQRLKQDCSLLVVSHDLREVSPLVDTAWVMKTGGLMEAMDSWPPAKGFNTISSTVDMLK